MRTAPLTRRLSPRAPRGCTAAFRSRLALALAATLLCGGALAEPRTAPDVSLTDLSLEELTNIEVSTAARRTQRASDVAAAMFVITQDDIRRVGARSIPQALRLAPGLQVAQIDASRWAVAARGFNGRFANKLLVLMDGRTLYTPTFSGTYWDAQDTAIEDIERIEVMLGPAGTIWGTNAVNGIINIITKRATQANGASFTGAADGDGDASMLLRFASAANGADAWRAYLKASEWSANELLDGADAADDGDQLRAGVRADLQLANSDALLLAGEGYRGRSGQTLTGSLLAPSSADAASADRERLTGVWGMAGWRRSTSSDARLQVQLYADHAAREGAVYGERRDTFDAQFQYDAPVYEGHVFTWGAGARLNRDRITSSELVQVTPPETSFWLLSLYLQDEVSLLDDRLHATAGVRFEDADERGGRAVLPNLRAILHASPDLSIWAAVGRGERRPARVDADIHVPGAWAPPQSETNPFPAPLATDLNGGARIVSEQLQAYELGVRIHSSERYGVDVAAFYNVYDRLLGVDAPIIYCNPAGVALESDPLCAAESLTADVRTNSSVSGVLYGGEVLARWAPLRRLRFIAGYTLLRKDVVTGWSDSSVDGFVVGFDPDHQYSLRSTLNLGPRWDIDLAARAVGAAAPADSYEELSARLAWRPFSHLNWEMALLGDNLLHRAHLEAVSEFADLSPTRIERTVMLQLRWSPR